MPQLIYGLLNDVQKIGGYEQQKNETPYGYIPLASKRFNIFNYGLYLFGGFGPKYIFYRLKECLGYFIISEKYA